MLEILMATGWSFPNIDPVAVSIGPFVLRWYSLAYIAGIFIGWYRLARFSFAPDAPYTKQQADDFIMWATIGIILGGRLGYVLFYNFGYYLDNPGQIFQVWNGGMSFHGGFAGVVIAALLFCRKHKINVLGFGDRIAAVSPVGLFFGRLANFINGELWGRVTDHPLGMVFPTGGPEPRHPSQLYEAALEGVVLYIILNLALTKTRARKFPGIIIGLFFVLYGAFRYGIEFVREPDAHLGTLGGVLTMGQLLSLPMVFIGLGFILFAIRKAKPKAK